MGRIQIQPCKLTTVFKLFALFFIRLIVVHIHLLDIYNLKNVLILKNCINPTE